MKKLLIKFAVILTMMSCTKEKEITAETPSVKDTTWMVDMTITGNSFSQNIYEFNNNGNFTWHPVAAISYRGTWTQDKTTVNFTFKEHTPTIDYFWDNTGTLSSDGTLLTGTMKRRGVEGSGTFTAKKQ